MTTIIETAGQLRLHRREQERRGHNLHNGVVDLVSAMIVDYPNGIIVEPELASSLYSHLLVDQLRRVISPIFDESKHFHKLSASMKKGIPFLCLELKDRTKQEDHVVVSMELLVPRFDNIKFVIRGDKASLPEEINTRVKETTARLYREDGNIGRMKLEELRLGESLLRYAEAAYSRMANSEMGK